ncbi:unnamed protein product [Paramecium pentaurelia]|uniref:Uncharacterized protein n=1 Tax=Paramecium pentaurelia TaxID=43138 RepID=A0A8S1U656_9CILI|nr:unnamed protein product [Paramecium pentaurelia]
MEFQLQEKNQVRLNLFNQSRVKLVSTQSGQVSLRFIKTYEVTSKQKQYNLHLCYTSRSSFINFKNSKYQKSLLN